MLHRSLVEVLLVIRKLEQQRNGRRLSHEMESMSPVTCEYFSS
jgi:hypothetical protein